MRSESGDSDVLVPIALIIAFGVTSDGRRKLSGSIRLP